MKQDLCIMKRSLIWQKHCGLNASSEPRFWRLFLSDTGFKQLTR